MNKTILAVALIMFSTFTYALNVLPGGDPDPTCIDGDPNCNDAPAVVTKSIEECRNGYIWSVSYLTYVPEGREQRDLDLRIATQDSEQAFIGVYNFYTTPKKCP